MGEILSGDDFLALCLEDATIAADVYDEVLARLAGVEAERDDERTLKKGAISNAKEFKRQRDVAEARLFEVDQALREVIASHHCCDIREWGGDDIACGYCPMCRARAVLDRGEQG